ncbi:MAG: hypothetical protein ACOVLC_01930 [Flavobacterium sp.]
MQRFQKKEDHKSSEYALKQQYDNSIIGGTEMGSPDKNRDKLFNEGFIVGSSSPTKP